MDPIINPLWFYIISLSENIAVLASVVAVLLVIVIPIGIMIIALPDSTDDCIDIWKTYRKFFILGAITLTVFPRKVIL